MKNLKDLTVPDLRKEASKLKIKNYIKLRRPDLEKAIEDRIAENQKVNKQVVKESSEIKKQKLKDLLDDDFVEQPTINPYDAIDKVNGGKEIMVKKQIEKPVELKIKESIPTLNKKIKSKLLESNVVKGLQVGSKVKFITAPNSKVAPKQELEGTITYIKDCNKLKQEVVRISTSKGDFWKISKGINF